MHPGPAAHLQRLARKVADFITSLHRCYVDSADRFRTGTRLAEVADRTVAADRATVAATPLFVVLQRRRRLVMVVLGATLSGALVVSLVQRIVAPQYQGRFRLLVSDPINKEDRERAASPSVEELVIRPPANARTPDLVEVLKSPLLIDPLARQFGQPPQRLERSLTVKTPNRQVEGVLEITLRWGDREQAGQLLRALAQSYLDYSLIQRQEKLRQGLAFLDQQAPALQRRVAAMQQDLSTFRRRHQFLEPAKRGEAIQLQRQTLDNRLDELQQRQAQLSGLARAVRSGQLTGPAFQEPGRVRALGTDNEPLASGAFSTLLADLTSVEKQLAEAQATYRSVSPVVRSLRARRDRLRPLLQQREQDAIAAAYQETVAQQAQIRRQQAQLARDFADQPGLIKDYDTIEQQLDVARDNLTAYIKARENFRLEVAQKILPWQLIAPPSVDPEPVSPDLERNLIMALLIGGVAGSGAALLRERLDPLVHHREDLPAVLQQQQLGSVPLLPLVQGAPLARALEALDGTKREQLRALAMQLRHHVDRQHSRLLAFSASGVGEGTSTSALLVAQTLAELGVKVLLVDADLRRPALHRLAGVDNKRGLSTLLSDAECSFASVIQRLPSGLDLLTAGPRPRDSTRLLHAKRLRTLLTQWQQPSGYQLVLLDTPEVMERSDGLVLRSLVDATVLVVGLGLAHGLRLEQAIARIRHNHGVVLGVITTHRFSAATPLLSRELLSQRMSLRWPLATS